MVLWGDKCDEGKNIRTPFWSHWPRRPGEWCGVPNREEITQQSHFHNYNSHDGGGGVTLLPPLRRRMPRVRLFKKWKEDLVIRVAIWKALDLWWILWHCSTGGVKSKVHIQHSPCHWWRQPWLRGRSAFACYTSLHWLSRCRKLRGGGGGGGGALSPTIRILGTWMNQIKIHFCMFRQPI